MGWQQVLLGSTFIITGIAHFIWTRFYIKMMPKYIPFQRLLVVLSGVTEVLAGVMLFYSPTEKIGALGIILMLIVFIPIHVSMITGNAFKKVNKLFLWGRLVLQFFFIYWVFNMYF